MLAFIVTTGSYEDTQNYGVIVTPDEVTAQYHLDRAQLAIARERRSREDSQMGNGTMPVLRMERADLLNEDVLVQHGGDDAAMPTAYPRGSVASS